VASSYTVPVHHMYSQRPGSCVISDAVDFTGFGRHPERRHRRGCKWDSSWLRWNPTRDKEDETLTVRVGEHSETRRK